MPSYLCYSCVVMSNEVFTFPVCVYIQWTDDTHEVIEKDVAVLCNHKYCISYNECNLTLVT